MILGRCLAFASSCLPSLLGRSISTLGHRNEAIDTSSKRLPNVTHFPLNSCVQYILQSVHYDLCTIALMAEQKGDHVVCTSNPKP